MPVIKSNTIAINLPPTINREKHLAFISGVIEIYPNIHSDLDDVWLGDWIPDPNAPGIFFHETYLVGPEWVNGTLSPAKGALPHHVTAITNLGSVDGDGDNNGWAVDDWEIHVVDSDVNPGAGQRIQLRPYVKCIGDSANVNRLSFFVAAKGTLLEPATVGL